MEVWSREISGCPMYILSQKLKNLKAILKVWNKEVFGDIHGMVRSAQTNLNGVQQQISVFGYSDELNEQEILAQNKLDQTLSYQEEFWRSKARVNRFTHGDRNTSFFHKMTKIMYASKQMSILKTGDNILESQDDIEQHVLNYYTNLYCSENACTNSDFTSNAIPNMVSMEDNIM